MQKNIFLQNIYGFTPAQKISSKFDQKWVNASQLKKNFFYLLTLLTYSALFWMVKIMSLSTNLKHLGVLNCFWFGDLNKCLKKNPSQPVHLQSTTVLHPSLICLQEDTKMLLLLLMMMVIMMTRITCPILKSASALTIIACKGEISKTPVTEIRKKCQTHYLLFRKHCFFLFRKHRFPPIYKRFFVFGTNTSSTIW